MSIFDRVIPFPQRVRWSMLKAAIQMGVSASTIAARLDWPLHKVRKIVMAPNAQVRIADIGDWFWAIDENLEVKVNIIPRQTLGHNPRGAENAEER